MERTLKQRSDMRSRIIQAAAKIMHEKGIARATTKEIARAAGCSEGNLYNYFQSKEEIFLSVLRELSPGFVSLMIGLSRRAGQGRVEGNLAEVATAALHFYRQTVPMAASFFSEKKLLASHRRLLKERGRGPQRANEAVAAYLQAEQQLGRVRKDVNVRAVADLLLGACFQQAYWTEFLGESMEVAAEERYVREIVELLAPRVLPQK